MSQNKNADKQIEFLIKGIVFILFLGVILGLIISLPQEFKVKNYTGVVIDKGYEAPTSGYRSHRNAVYFIVLKDEECNCSVRVHVTVPTYYKLQIGSRVGFDLNKTDLANYGNGNEHLK